MEYHMGHVKISLPDFTRHKLEFLWRRTKGDLLSNETTAQRIMVNFQATIFFYTDN
jgi:hypothetical protein